MLLANRSRGAASFGSVSGEVFIVPPDTNRFDIMAENTESKIGPGGGQQFGEVDEVG